MQSPRWPKKSAARRGEFEDFHRRLSLTDEDWYLQQTPQGEMCIVYLQAKIRRGRRDAIIAATSGPTGGLMPTTAVITAQSALASALESAHSILEATMADVTDEVAGRPVPGTANSVGSSYAHAVFAEDAIVNSMLKQQAPLAATDVGGTYGFRPANADGRRARWRYW